MHTDTRYHFHLSSKILSPSPIDARRNQFLAARVTVLINDVVFVMARLVLVLKCNDHMFGGKF